MVGGPEILAVDDFGEADDGVERGLDLMDQLAQRIRVGEQVFDPFPERRAVVSRSATPR